MDWMGFSNLPALNQLSDLTGISPAYAPKRGVICESLIAALILTSNGNAAKKPHFVPNALISQTQSWYHQARNKCHNIIGLPCVPNT